ncbi:MAG: hypothetical protein AAFQ63_12060 [Cyanobacteria bacterium J06621_11]
MAYDSETYGQSPFGTPKKASAPKPKASEPEASVPEVSYEFEGSAIDDDGLDMGPGELVSPASKMPSRPQTATQSSVKSTARKSTTRSSTRRTAKKDTSAAEAAAFSKALQPSDSSGEGFPSIGRIAGKLGIGKAIDKLTNRVSDTVSSDATTPKSRTSTKTTAGSTTSKKSSRKSKKTKAAEAAQAEAEAAIARRFQEEDRSAYLSLLYKTGISMLIWAVLRLSRHELSENAIALINILIHPLLVASVTIIAVAALTFWLRRLLNDLARHTQQLSADAEETGGKNYRPTLEIVGDSLEYNPHLRKKLALFFDVASMLICTLVSYLITSALLP